MTNRRLDIPLEYNYRRRLAAIYALLIIVFVTATVVAFTMDHVTFWGRTVLAEFDGVHAHLFGCFCLIISAHWLSQSIKELRGWYIAPKWPYLAGALIGATLITAKYW